MMSILPHTVAGAIAGSFFENPVLGGTAGFISHLVLDFIPHWEPEAAKGEFAQRKLLYGLILSIDLLGGMLILYWVKDYPAMFWGGLIGAAVDLDNFFQYAFKSGPFPILSKIGIKTHQEDSGWHNKAGVFWGTLGPVLIVVLGALLILSKIGFPQFLLPFLPF